MARLIRAGEFVGRGEERAAAFLEQKLPASWVVICNKELVAPGGAVREIDFIVIGDHAVFVLEEKSWSGSIHGNENGWVLRTGESYPSPIAGAGAAARRLAGLLRSQVPLLADTVKQHFVFERVLLSAENAQLFVHDPRCSEKVLRLEGCHEELQRSDRLQRGAASFGGFRQQILAVLVGLPDRPRIPRRIRDYEVLEALPGTGVVRCFRARHPDGSERLLKLLERPSGADAEQRTSQEAALLREYNALRHLAESSRTPGVDPYFSWEEERYWVVPIHPVSGRSLRADRTDTPPPPQSILAVVKDAFAALAEIHGAGVVHRALNPDRVHLRPDRRAIFSDFIIARIHGARTIADQAEELEPGDAYRAPECRVDLGLAEPASDVFSLAASLLYWICGHEPGDEAQGFAILKEVRSDLGERVGGLLEGVFQRCLVEDKRQRPSAGEVLRQIQEGEEQAQKDTPGSAEARPAGREPGTLLADQYRIIRVLGEGATAVTYLAEDTVGGGFFVLKTIRNPELIAGLARAEFRSLLDLNHPNLPRVYDIRPPASPFHLKLEYVPGSSLREVREQLRGNLKQCLWIAEQVLNALAYLEERRLLHRDISPSNILLPDEGAGAVKLVDFGLATQQTGTTSAVGTPRYRPPENDRGEPWNRTCDLYSLGVVLFELLTGRLPYEVQNEVPRKAHLVALSDEEIGRFGRPLLGALLKAVAPDPGGRYASAREFAQELRAGRAVERVPAASGEEVVNHVVNALRGAYRNSRIGNPDNRGLDTDFAKDTYVPTRLDTDLVPQLLEGRFRLVILSGNPGDGKTAFLQRFRDILRQRGAMSEREDTSGWRYHLAERVYVALYDASESHEGKTSDELLREILRPLEGPAPPDAAHTAAIAVNDGRLLDYFDRYGALRYPWLWEQVRAQLEVRQADPSVLVVDLKRRCLVSDDPGRDSLFSRILDEFLSDARWAPCQRCVARNECPIKFNADSVRDEALGLVVRRRLHSLLLAVHLRREHRPTVRDLRSALSYLITHDVGCEEIHAQRRSGNSPIAEPGRLYFQAAFNGTGSPDLLLDEWTSLDPAGTPSPRLDRFLHFHRSRDQAEQVGKTLLTPARRHDAALLTDPEWLGGEWRRTMKQRYFFEADPSAEGTRRWELPDAEDLLPHRHMREFAKALGAGASGSALRDLVARGISRADGVPGAVGRDALALRLTETGGEEFSVVKLFPIEEFRCRGTPMTMGFAEEIPDQFLFEHVTGVPSLAVGLDLFELLARMAEGYLPGADEHASLIQDLIEFKNQLLARPSQEVVLVEGGQRIHRIDARGGKIRQMGTPQ